MKKIYLSLAILAGIGLAGCNDSFLDACACHQSDRK